MKPIFTIHEGEFLVGDHINRKFGGNFETSEGKKKLLL